MSASIGASASAAASAASATTSAVTTQAIGSTFVVGVGTYTSSPVQTPTDSKSNTYTAIELQQSYFGGSQLVRWYYCQNGTGGSGHTFSGSGTSANVVNVYAVEIIGGLTSGILDQHNVGNDTATPFVSPTITPTVSDSIAIAFLAGGGASSPASHTESNGFTILANTDQTDGNNFLTGCFAYKSLSSTAGVAASFTEATNLGDTVLFIANFKSAAGAASNVGVPWQQQAQMGVMVAS